MTDVTRCNQRDFDAAERYEYAKKQKKQNRVQCVFSSQTVRNEATYAVVIMSRSFPANYFPTNCNMEFQNSVGINI